MQQIAEAARAKPGSRPLAKAAAILQRLDRGDMYQLVAEAELPQQQRQQDQQVGLEGVGSVSKG